jgi:acetyl esterase/lipase
MKKIFLLFVAVQMISMGNAQTIIPLYDGAIPGSKPVVNKEKDEKGTDGGSRISKVSAPTLSVFLPAKEKANGTAVIICPGGGYVRLSMTKEGNDVAKVLNEWGITAFVLKYRLPEDSIMEQKEIGPLQDAQRAIQLVRSRAAEYNIDQNKVGIIGFSAGGHLASTAGTHFKKAVIPNKPRINLRPDFMILMYPVISLTDSLAHKGSQVSLLGKNPSPRKIKLFSNEFHVTKKTPPTFLVHAKDDKTVKVENSIIFYNQLQKKKVPAEIHLYEKGGHGFGLNNTTSTDKWTDWLKVWMKDWLK